MLGAGVCERALPLAGAWFYSGVADPGNSHIQPLTPPRLSSLFLFLCSPDFQLVGDTDELEDLLRALSIYLPTICHSIRHPCVD
jgi:hypothetical protein